MARTTTQFSITLPEAMANFVKEKVASGEYATESEILRDGLRTLLARDRHVDDWLKSRVAAAYDDLKENPGAGLSVAQLRERMALKRDPVDD